MNFFRSLKHNKDLRSKMYITILLLIAFRFLSYVPIPWVNAKAIRELMNNPIFDLAGMFSGGALAGFTLMATGISSYITASIIIQLLTYSVPKMYEMSNSPGAQDAMKRITVILGIVLSMINSLGMTIMLNRNFGLLTNDSKIIYILIAIIHSIGTGIAVYIGETITEKGIGNGVSLLIFTNIVSQLPGKVINLYKTPEFTINQKILFASVVSFMIIMVVILELSEKRIDVLYAKNIINSSATGIQSPTFIPLKLNINGVMPIIFATTILQTFTVLGSFFDNKILSKINEVIGMGTPLYPVLNTLLIFAFSFFYSSLIFNPKDIAENLQNSGGIVSNLRPGKATARYIQREGKEVTTINAIFLAVLSLLPVLVLARIGFPVVGATTMMIVINVSIELYSDIKTEVDLTKNTLLVKDIMKK